MKFSVNVAALQRPRSAKPRDSPGEFLISGRSDLIRRRRQPINWEGNAQVVLSSRPLCRGDAPPAPMPSTTATWSGDRVNT